MKINEAKFKYFWPPECELEILIGTREEAEEKSRIMFPKRTEHEIPEESYGLTRTSKENRKILLFINEQGVQNSDGERTLASVLLHELIHVKQIVEKRFMGEDECWPIEFEASYVQCLFQEVSEKMKI